MLPILAIAAWSGTGKTTLLKQLIPLLKEQGVRPGLIKHTHHDMDVDIPGKDSYELRKAGADQVLVASQQRWALMTETPDNEAIDFNFLISRMDARSLDLILVEGFKDEPIPRIVLCRDRSEEEIKILLDEHVIAVASDRSFDVSVPLLNLNDPPQIANFIVQWLKDRS
ncbi:molybdopterin-guanine dinucleotide biosynthesis protein B [Mixta theicola]|uniref:Molybdopterin-guanine dinucleotide biosynthesis protein B n=1 Tax=Mixta theicola TaxID=1458355 RepID=A0A2K1Q6S8_9GAMM|nr:molybdopterin-guanine dinucleotide biosynthesis protein MobB [Mixta theicola]PNS10708.1 molybdopterin-guanine dinucleotide biosynthesis protein B [Mixta theicola]GLR08925.1 molybdopterin-guanine dinucleotide biosynthesis protein B [Mixta theicola]